MPSSGSCGQGTRGVIFNFGYLGTNKTLIADSDRSCQKYPIPGDAPSRSGIVRSGPLGLRTTPDLRREAMPDLGNVWHIPDSPEPRGLAGMRDPVGAIVPGTILRIFTGNQFQGIGGTPGDRSEERRVGKEGRCRWGAYRERQKKTERE